MELEIILEGLTDSIKEKIGKYSSAKELWAIVVKRGEKYVISINDKGGDC